MYLNCIFAKIWLHYDKVRHHKSCSYYQFKKSIETTVLSYRAASMTLQVSIYSMRFTVSVLLSTVGVADQAIVVDSTGPFAGTVYDGPNFKTDLQFSKDENKVK